MKDRAGAAAASETFGISGEALLVVSSVQRRMLSPRPCLVGPLPGHGCARMLVTHLALRYRLQATSPRVQLTDLGLSTSAEYRVGIHELCYTLPASSCRTIQRCTARAILMEGSSVKARWASDGLQASGIRLGRHISDRVSSSSRPQGRCRPVRRNSSPTGPAQRGKPLGETGGGTAFPNPYVQHSLSS